MIKNTLKLHGISLQTSDISLIIDKAKNNNQIAGFNDRIINSLIYWS